MSFDKLKTLLDKKSFSSSSAQDQAVAAQKKSGDQPHKKLASREDKAVQREVQQQRKKRLQEALRWLRETFPSCFNLDPPRPLKIGVIHDLMAFCKSQDVTPFPSRLSLRKALEYYTHGRLYHESVLTTSHRCDLEGNPAQEITEKEREYARDQLTVLERQHQQWQEHKKKREAAIKNSRLEHKSGENSF